MTTQIIFRELKKYLDNKKENTSKKEKQKFLSLPFRKSIPRGKDFERMVLASSKN